MKQSKSAPPLNDSVLDCQIGVLLRTGMMMAATVILIGGVIFLAEHAHQNLDFHLFKGEPAELKSLTGIVLGATHGNALSIIQFGLLILIATPVARVIFSVVAFLKARDYLYVAISGIVLMVLLYSLIWH